MGLFAMRKPRRFHHPYIYVDERKERREQMVREARRELGLDAGKPVVPEDIRGKFLEHATHLRRRRQAGTRPWPVAVLLVLLGLLACLWYALERGLM